MKRLLCAVMFVATLALFTINVVVVDAGLGENILKNLNTIGTDSGFNVLNAETSLPFQIGVLIRGIMGFLGLVFLILVVFAGYKWMLAHGEPGEVKEAQKLLIHSIVGLLITASAYALSSFVINAISSSALTP